MIEDTFRNQKLIPSLKWYSKQWMNEWMNVNALIVIACSHMTYEFTVSPKRKQFHSLCSKHALTYAHIDRITLGRVSWVWSRKPKVVFHYICLDVDVRYTPLCSPQKHLSHYASPDWLVPPALNTSWERYSLIEAKHLSSAKRAS